jgi:DNA-directed RNA polymerase subunit RPC12/RpoP
MLRTVYAYRSRVRLVYRLYYSQEKSEKPEEIPIDADLDAIFAQLSGNEAPPTLPDTEELPSAGDTATVEMQATFRCSRCQAEVLVPIEELDNATTCPCGGKLVQL